MLFKRITIENFKSIGPKPITIEFDFNGSRLLLGQNGAGKSSIFEAIVWGLYGTTKLKADNVVNKTIGSGAKVEIEFAEKKHAYVITRYRKHPQHKNNCYIFEDGNNITLKNQAYNQDLINSIVGIDSKAFLASIVLSSETYRPFLRETASNRLQIFESVFSLKDVNELAKQNRLKLKEIGDEVSRKTMERSSLVSFIEADKTAIKEYKNNYTIASKKLDDRIIQYENEVESKQKALEELSQLDLDEAMKSAIEYQTAKTNLDNLIREKSNIEASLKTCEANLKSEVRKFEDYTTYIAKYPAEYLSRQLQLNKDVKEAEERLSALKSKRTELSYTMIDVSQSEKQLSTLEKKMTQLRKKLSNINESICPTCGHVMNEEETIRLRNEAELEITETQSEIDSMAADINRNKEQNQITQSSIDALTKEINNINSPVPDCTIEDIKEIASTIKLYRSELPSIGSNIERYESDRKNLEGKLSMMSIASIEFDGMTIDDINDAKTQTIKLRSEIESAKSAIETAKSLKESSFNKAYILKTMNAIKERQEVVESLDNELKTLKKENAVHKVLEELFSNGENGFKKYFISKTIKMFNDKLNTFLPFFFDDEIEIRFDKDLNDTIKFRGKEAEIAELSSGEKTRCELCISFTLFYIAKSIFGAGTNILVLDEVLDQNLDLKGTMAARHLIDDIAKDTSVFVVSHKEELKESFKDVLEIRKDGDGFTCIK